MLADVTLNRVSSDFYLLVETGTKPVATKKLINKQTKDHCLNSPWNIRQTEQYEKRK